MSLLSIHVPARFAQLAPLVARVVAGLILLVHGVDKLRSGPSGFGEFMHADLGIPAPALSGWLVTGIEVVGGALLIIGLVARIAAAVLILHLLGAIALVNAGIGFITPLTGGGTGVEFPLSVIASLAVVLLIGPGPLSLDRALGVETSAVAGSDAPTTVHPSR